MKLARKPLGKAAIKFKKLKDFICGRRAMSKSVFRLMILYVDGAKEWWKSFIEDNENPEI
jgi:hypothetical protein